ncbi:MAG TPA: TAT-variant-translocated molybdopterin oxidoreductase [Pyrinomonadaceae bacterium]|nr:TAT-variant-translocated molybdopterin oxidoreductase [Pyrinomonadaceae bacterium]
MASNDRHINFALMRDRILAQQDGKNYWRSLEELSDSPEFHEFVQREYPQHAEQWDDPIERRTFLKLMGASLALAGLSGCVYQPPEKIVPFVRQPEEMVPGRPLFFATAASVSGIATPLLVRSNEGRPTKVEGNPDHPNNRNASQDDRGSSATDLFSQASILTLYDPDRSQTLTYREEIRTWTAFVGAMRTALEAQREKQGAGLRFLTETVTSPSLGGQLQAILNQFPQAKWHQYEPAGRDSSRAAAVMAFGQPVNTTFNFDQAQRILALDSDFLACGPGSLRYARDFAARRRVVEGKTEMSRLYVVETTPTNTGAAADHHWVVRPSQMEAVATAIAERLGVELDGTAAATDAINPQWLDAMVRDLQQHRGSSIVVAGAETSPVIQALAHGMNEALGNVGRTVFNSDPLDVNSVDQRESLRDLIQDIDGGRVELLVILGGNPVYNTPADLKLDFNRLAKVNLRAHLSLYKDETSAICHWHVPEAHYLESWSDTRTFDGTVSIVQPLIEPLYGGKTAHEVLALFSDQYDRSGYDIVRSYWQGRMPVSGQPTPTATASPEPAATSQEPPARPTDSFEAQWRKALHDGFIAGSALTQRSVSFNTAALNKATAASPSSTAGDFELVFRPDPTVHDGRFANNGWLQELPKPLTKLTWDNAALISPNTARLLNLENTIGGKGGEIQVDNIRIEVGGRSVICPAWIMPGQPDNVVTVHLGYGRPRAGNVGTGLGFSAYEIRTSEAPWWATGARVAKTGTEFQLAVTQLHFNMENRDILRTKTLAAYLHGEHDDHGHPTHVPTEDETLHGNPFKYEGYAWGMAIDASSCVGCNACVVACQSENNIPIVGKEQVVRSREMHWLRVDTYFKGEDANHPEGPFFMPVPCMHCENAPCEPVCPVHATVHSAEGLNDMVYNRCIGTRYCSNNCPYKVRRFNFLLYQDWTTPTYQLMRNPEVSVRSRGVMEKCTYCVQRIQSAKITAEIENRSVRDGEIVTACQAVCPTEAIVFGDINDPNSRVSRLKAEERNYGLLVDLNTKPRTTYLAALRNPNPEIDGKHAA